jgi:hypothetical protein
VDACRLASDDFLPVLIIAAGELPIVAEDRLGSSSCPDTASPAFCIEPVSSS